MTNPLQACRLAVLYIAAFSAPAGAQADMWSTDAGAGGQYATGFEEFAPGNIGDQNGWVGINGAFTVTTINEHAGSQHFRGVSTGGAWSFARSPFITAAGSFSHATAWISIGQGTAAPWEFTPGIANQGGITTVRFNADRTIDVLIASAIPEGTFVPTGASAPLGYFELRVVIQNSNGAFEVFLDGESIATGNGLIPGGVEAVIVYSDMPPGTAGHTLDMDDLEIGTVTTAVDDAPDVAFISTARPSPFTSTSALDLRVATSQRVVATLHDVLGRRVATLYQGTVAAGALRRLIVDGAGLAPGPYAVRVQGETFAASRRLIRLR